MGVLQLRLTAKPRSYLPYPASNFELRSVKPSCPVGTISWRCQASPSAEKHFRFRCDWRLIFVHYLLHFRLHDTAPPYVLWLVVALLISIARHRLLGCRRSSKSSPVYHFRLLATFYHLSSITGIESLASYHFTDFLFLWTYMSILLSAALRSNFPGREGWDFKQSAVAHTLNVRLLVQGAWRRH